MAVRAGVPVLPAFITMQDDETRLDGHNYPMQRHTLHIMPPVYPDASLNEKQAAQKMLNDTFALYKAKYEEVYGIPLAYAAADGEKADKSALWADPDRAPQRICTPAPMETVAVEAERKTASEAAI